MSVAETVQAVVAHYTKNQISSISGHLIDLSEVVDIFGDDTMNIMEV
jgi:hypothetical protein